MSDVHAVARDQLLAFITRIERLEEEKKTIADDIKDVKAEAKGCGFDVGTINAIIKLRKVDANERAERDALLDTYLIALGMLPEPEEEESANAKLITTVATGMQTEIGREALVTALDIMIEREEAEERRSDAGLNIVTKHTEITNAPETATELSRPATSAVSGGEPSKPSSDVGGVKMDGCSHPGRPDAVSGMHITQSEQATNSNSQSDDGAIAEVKGSAQLANATGVEPSSSERLSDQPLTGGDHEVASSAMRAGLVDPTSNTGEGAASALPAKPKVSYRPNCQHPENCASGTRDHCWSCRRAMQKSEEMA